jgi:putative ABC transport system permease protein
MRKALNTKLMLRLRIMFLAMRKSGFRSLMAVGSVGLGIGSMMIMLALSSGAERELQAITERVGKNLFVIKAADVPPLPGRGTGWFTSTRLDRRDEAVLRQQVDGINAIVPIMEGSFSTRLHGKELATTIRGVTPGFPDLRNFQLQEGRFLDDDDGLARSRVAVVGSFIAERLNDGFSVLGETIWINNVPFTVVGQMKEKGFSDGQNEDDQILIPFETAQRRLLNVDSVTCMLVQVRDPGVLARVQTEARELLRSTHRLAPGTRDDFDILSLLRADQVRAMNSSFLEGLSKLFAAITLAIGGAGVLAVTFLNVKDRTSEIGLRMAIGARQKDIAGLFMSEACLLSALGGMAGIAVGWAAVFVLTKFTQWQMAVEWRGIVIPFLVSVVLGLVFGVLPALKASRVMPVEALRDA